MGRQRVIVSDLSMIYSWQHGSPRAGASRVCKTLMVGVQASLRQGPFSLGGAAYLHVGSSYRSIRDRRATDCEDNESTTPGPTTGLCDGLAS